MISLLNIESALGSFGDDAIVLARNVLDKTEIPNQGAENDLTRETIEGLMSTANWACSLISARSPLVKEELLQRIMVNCKGEEYIYNAYVEFSKSLNDEEKLKRIRHNTTEEIQNHYNSIEIEKILKRARNEVIFNKAKLNWSEFIAQIILELEPFQRMGGDGALEALGVISRLTIGDADAVSQYYKPKDANQASLVDRIFKWGWQGVNKFFGSEGGLRAIDMGLVSALSHNFKSGFLLNSFRQFAVYNNPYPTLKPHLKPMGLFISYEQTSDEHYNGLYCQMMLNQTGECINPKTISKSIDEIAPLVRDYLEQNGWHIEIVHVDPDSTNFRKLFSLIEYYESLGYEIQFCVIDSLHKLSNEGCTQGPFGVDIKNKYSRCRNFFAARGTALLTAHQMNSKAGDMARMGFTDTLVKEVKEKGMYDGCSTLHQEPGIEIYLHKVEPGDGGTYLTLGRGKYRTQEIIPTKDQYCVYRFSDNGAPGFPDDINGPSMALARVGADNETAFNGDF